MKTDAEIKQLAVDTLADKIFWMTMIDRIEDVGMVFMVFALMEPEDRRALLANRPILYEYIDKAGPRSVNGYPCFMSFQWVTDDDYQKVITKAREIKAAIDAA
jgi:hypothetical protein